MNSTSTVGPVVETTWTNNPMIVAILFGFAGTVFVGLYLLRTWRARRKSPTTKVV
jgi:hypothetical protein